jgi:hypothetical protein|tara:strand:- start:329 stop:733 length:405 start_codon:yes stop_codon:yes gene_type:complete
MKSLKKYIKEEITRLSERQFPIPPKILDILKNKLKMDPLIRYVENLKAVNSIPPSYRVFLINGESFDLIDEDFSLLVKIGSKEYFLNDIDEKNYAIKHINRLLTGSKIKPEDEKEEMGGDLPPPPPESPIEPEV